MKRVFSVITIVASGLLIGTISTANAASVQITKEEAKELSATAATRADHLKLAEFFNNEAARLEAEAVEHEQSAYEHRGLGYTVGAKGPMTGKTSGHCQFFGKVARDKAGADRNLAAEHERAANELR